jgi:phosphatidylinositol alpha 1,6-mannosyltransferase
VPDKLRVVLTTGNYNYIKDGVSLTLNRLVAWLEAHGHEVLVVAPVAETPAMEHEGRLEPVPSFAIPTRKEYRIGLKLTDHVRREIGQFRPDLFHIAVPDITGHSALKPCPPHAGAGGVVIPHPLRHLPAVLRAGLSHAVVSPAAARLL